MARPFRGKITLDIRDAVPDWGPFVAPSAPAGAPNVLVIVWDDVGFGTFDCFGGLVEAPAMRRLAERGLRFTQFHTTALCSPTRACLMTGRNATSNGMAMVTDYASGFPGTCGRIPFANGLLSEVLVEQGWNTYALGKWHTTPQDEQHVAATRRHWPLGRGFERFYGFLGGETNQWYPDLVYDNHPIEPPAKPEDGYHLSKDLADKAIEFVRDAKMIDPDKPWLMFFCPGAGHAPHHVFRDWADRYNGRFDMGYERYREIVLANQKRMGIVPPDTRLPPLNPYADVHSAEGRPWPAGDIVPPWDTLSADEQRLMCRMAEVYAGFITYTDAQIGRLLDVLEETGELDNTLVIALSDNGASGEGGPFGTVNENKFFNGVADSMEANLRHLDDLGGVSTYNTYSNGWGMAFNTPYKLFKRYASHEGGTADSLIVAWPKGLPARGELRHQYVHVIDLVPTIYDLLGIEPPETVKGYPQTPLEGQSFRAALGDPEAPPPKETQYYGMLGTRAIWHKGWLANTVHASMPSGWGHFPADQWELYYLPEDRNQLRNLASQYPERLEMMKNLWFFEAGKYQGLPLEDRTALEVMASPRPGPAAHRQRFVYYPDGAPVPTSAAANVIGRSYRITADLTLDSPTASGTVFAQGSRFGGHTLFLKDGKAHYVYNWLGDVEQTLTADRDLPAGRVRLAVAFELRGREEGVPVGVATLFLDDQAVARADIKTLPAMFPISGSGVRVGRDGLQSVSVAYEAPFAFQGGEIHQVEVTVSGEPAAEGEERMARALAQD